MISSSRDFLFMADFSLNAHTRKSFPRLAWNRNLRLLLVFRNCVQMFPSLRSTGLPCWNKPNSNLSFSFPSNVCIRSGLHATTNDHTSIISRMRNLCYVNNTGYMSHGQRREYGNVSLGVLSGLAQWFETVPSHKMLFWHKQAMCRSTIYLYLF